MTFEWRHWKDNELLCVVQAASFAEAIKQAPTLLGPMLYGMSWIARVK